MYQRKDGRWCESVRIDGMSRPKDFYGKTKAEVNRKIAAWRGDNEKGVLITDALEVWLTYKESQVSYKTLEGYKAPVKKIKESFGKLHMKELTPAMVQAFVNAIAKAGYKRSTVQRPLDILRMLYDYYITMPGSTVQFNPTLGVSLPNLKQERRELASAEDVQRVKDNVSLNFGLFAYLLMYTGCRKGEALALRWEDFDFEKKQISITKEVSWQPNKPIVKEPKTPDSVRTIVLLAPLEEALPKKWSGYLFSADGGVTPFTQTEWRHRWDNYCRAAGLADAHEVTHTNPKNKHTYVRIVWENRIEPHQMRHEFATLCFEADLDPADAKELLGHASETTTRQIYTHIRETRRERTSNKLQEYVQNA